MNTVLSPDNWLVALKSEWHIPLNFIMSQPPNSSRDIVLESFLLTSDICRVGNDRDGNDINISYSIYGTGPQKIVFIMGLNGTSVHWGFQAAYFASNSKYQVCIFDNRGNGFSSAPPGPYTTKVLANDTLELLNHLGWSENVHLVGVSMGGMVSQMLVLQDLTRFASVTFTSTYNASALVVPTVSDLKIFLKMTARSRQGLVRPLIKTCFPKAWLNEEFSPGVTNFQFLEESCKKINEDSPHKTMAGEHSQLVSTLVHNVPPHELKKISKAGVRCLVLHGTRDFVIRPVYGKLLSSFLSCPLVLFKKSGHMLMIERRDEFNAILEAHLENQSLQAYLPQNELGKDSSNESVPRRLVFSTTSVSDSIKREESDSSGTAISQDSEVPLSRSISLPKSSQKIDELSEIPSSQLAVLEISPNHTKLDTDPESDLGTRIMKEQCAYEEPQVSKTFFSRFRKSASPTFLVPCITSPRTSP